MSAKHTPGPWYVREAATPSHSPLIMCGSDCIATVWKTQTVSPLDGQTFPAEANARLIAAAPELLAEAKELLRGAAFADGQGIILTQDAEALERAIAKAEGRES